MVRTALVVLLLLVASASSILAEEPETPRLRIEGEDFVLTLPEKAFVKFDLVTTPRGPRIRFTINDFTFETTTAWIRRKDELIKASINKVGRMTHVITLTRIDEAPPPHSKER